METLYLSAVEMTTIAVGLLIVTFSLGSCYGQLRHDTSNPWSDVISDPVVVTSRGAVMGSYEVSRGGHRYLSFRSIPYAQPPIGRLRFASPKGKEPWHGVLNASSDAPFCTQYNIISVENFDEDSFFGQEDCLYLSVFTHKVDVTRKRPVMVYIHGGGFESWTGARMHGPHFFMDHDLVAVFVNYRLGPFGFLSTEDSVVPGNFGLKDQLMALKWVHENIGKFGGDPESVTLFGESAGAASVHFHMKSSQSKGFFHRAVMNSGSVYSPWALAKSGVALSRTLKSAHLLNCSSDESISILNCLRRKSTADIIKLRQHFVEWDTDPVVVFPPVVERSGGFFTDDDLNRQTNVTLLTGLVSQEGAIKVSALLSRKFDYLTQLMSEFETWAPLTFGFGRPGQYPDLSRTVRKHYFDTMGVDSVQDPRFLRNLTQAYSDAWFASGLYKALKDHVGIVYRYKLERKPQISFIDLIGAKYPRGVEGASHGDDLLYLFNTTGTIPLNLLNSEDKIISNIIVKLWADFVINGDPGGIWRSTTDNNLLVITSDGSITMSKEHEDTYSPRFWHHLEKQVRIRSNQVRSRG